MSECTCEKMASGWMTKEAAQDLLAHGHWSRTAMPMMEKAKTKPEQMMADARLDEKG